MIHKKIYITFGTIAVIILAAVVPPLVVSSVKSGVSIPETTAQDILQAVETHFDHPIERIVVLRYQIAEQGTWRGADRYFVDGLTIFGIRFNRADVYMDGGIITIPSLENDFIDGG